MRPANEILEAMAEKFAKSKATVHNVTKLERFVAQLLCIHDYLEVREGGRFAIHVSTSEAQQFRS